MKIEQRITITADDGTKILELNREEAEELYQVLKKALGKNDSFIPTWPPVVKEQNPWTQPKWTPTTTSGTADVKDRDLWG